MRAAAIQLARRCGAGLALATIALGAAWSAGFALFEWEARQRAPVPAVMGTLAADRSIVADGIVALTGGATRIDTALALLSAGRAPLLLISGVGRGIELTELEHRVPLSPDQSARVSLGRDATSTLGNAEETAAWAWAHSLNSLFVVTAGYHMPRALLEIGRALPGVQLYPVPVQPPALRGGMDAATIRMLANEYDKFLAVAFGLTRRVTPARRPGGEAGRIMDVHDRGESAPAMRPTPGTPGDAPPAEADRS